MTDNIKVLLTAAGFHGAEPLIKSLKKKGIRVVGTDMNKNSPARFYCDGFYQVKSGRIDGYMEEMLNVLGQEQPNIIIPGSSYEVVPLSIFKKDIESTEEMKVLTSRQEVNEICIDKVKTYEKLEGVIDLPKWVAGDLIIKDPMGKGAREVKQDKGLAMEFLKGEQIDVDVLAYEGELLKAICKTRERAYGGTLVEGQIVDRPEIIEQIKKILKVLPIDYLSVFQFIGGKLIEINPRLAGAMFLQDINIVEMAIQLALGNKTKQQIKKIQIPFNRKIARFITQIEY
jgi:predicted ATP-grasp superfamily ATP-dependent carboligase